jgi:phospholipase/carboxylesterase
MPRGPLTLGAGQYAWFRVNFTSTGPVINEVEAEQSRHTVIRFVQQLQSTHGIAPQKTVIAGFSQGGILSASVALSSPASVAGFGILSGRILPELAPYIVDKVQLKPLRAFVGHGEFDNKLPVAWAQRSEQLLTDLGVTYTARRYPMGHEISAAMHADFVAWTNSITAGA